MQTNALKTKDKITKEIVNATLEEAADHGALPLLQDVSARRMILRKTCFFCIYCDRKGFGRHKITILRMRPSQEPYKKPFLNWNQYD
ncbi:hypothetical protein D3C73_488070 [compost metagenome]